jgi:acyl transferase domain-containing protein
MDFETIPTDDPIVSAVIRKMYQRSQVGIKKYGTTMERNDLSFTDWITHLQEELMDSIIYLEKLKSEKQK